MVDLLLSGLCVPLEGASMASSVVSCVSCDFVTFRLSGLDELPIRTLIRNW